MKMPAHAGKYFLSFNPIKSSNCLFHKQTLFLHLKNRHFNKNMYPIISKYLFKKTASIKQLEYNSSVIINAVFDHFSMILSLCY